MKTSRLRWLLLLVPLSAAAGMLAYRHAAPVPAPASFADAGGTAGSSARAATAPSHRDGTAAARALSAERLLDRWSGHVERVYGTPAARWKRAMRPTLGRLAAHDLDRALSASGFDAMMAALVASPGDAAMRPVAGAQARKAAVAAGAAYNVLAPCRLVDTRNISAPIDAGGAFHFRTSGPEYAAQGGAAGDCGVPADALAVVLNVTVVGPGGAGYLTVFPYGETMPLASSLNYTAGAIAGNEIIVGQASGPPYAVSVFSYARADAVVDVVGYFTAAPARTLGCTRVSSVSVLPHANYGAPSVECAYNPNAFRYSAPVGGSCRWLDLAPGAPPPGQLSGAIHGGYRYECSGDNFSGVDQRIMTTAICCDVAMPATP